MQAGILLLQSVILGFLTEYFNIQQPTDRDTRNAYLYALGMSSYRGLHLLYLIELHACIIHCSSWRFGDPVSGGGDNAFP